ncbi:MAG: aconitase family protein, partial [Pseudolabrys sp.]
LCRTLGMDNAFLAIEFAGEAVSAMTMASRMVLANMSAELGAETGIVAPDAVTLDYLARHGTAIADPEAALAWASDPDAAYVAQHSFAASDLVPQIAAPHSGQFGAR